MAATRASHIADPYVMDIRPSLWFAAWVALALTVMPMMKAKVAKKDASSVDTSSRMEKMRPVLDWVSDRRLRRWEMMEKTRAANVSAAAKVKSTSAFALLPWMRFLMCLSDANSVE